MDSSVDADMSGEWLRDVEDDNGPSRSAKPLRRGDACLACRKRRIKCSAEKPACATCVRLHKECVYDATQRPNRVTRLKDRIAELESQVERLKDSDGSTPTPLPDGFNTSFDFTAPVAGPSSGFNIGSNGSSQARSRSTTLSGHGRSSIVTPEENGLTSTFTSRIGTPSFSNTNIGAQDTDMLRTSNGIDPSSLLNASHATIPPVSLPWDAHHPTVSRSSNPRPLQQPDPSFAFDFGLLDPAMMNLTSNLMEATATFTNFFETTTPAPEQPSIPPSSLQPPPSLNSKGLSTSDLANIGWSPFGEPPAEIPQGLDEGRATIDEMLEVGLPTRLTGLRSDPPMRVASGSTFLPPSHPAFPYANLRVHSFDGPDAEPNPKHGLLGGWFDPDDVPPSVRDHLLDLYFGKYSSPSVFQNLINVPRFYARLTLPPSKRPHQSLMYMMYLGGATASSQPALRALEPTFFEIAQRKIQQGLKEADRLLDVVRALSLMTAYMFSKEWYNLGYNTAGSAIRLAIACGLNRIPSGVFTPPFKFNPIVHFTLRTGTYALEPPEDAIDLGERIQAFWAVYEVDQCTAVSYLWDPGFRVSEIVTPLPRPLEDYASGFVSASDDVRMIDVLSPKGNPSQPLRDDFHNLRLKALTLRAESVRLRERLPDRANYSTGLARSNVDPRLSGKYPPGFVSAKESVPALFETLKAALDRYCDELPSIHQTPWKRWDEPDNRAILRKKIRKDTAALWFLIGLSYYTIWNVRSLTAENESAVLVARRLAAIIGLYSGEELMGGYEAFIISMWNEISMHLLREFKRLEAFGRMEEAREVEFDLDTVIDALTEWAKVSSKSDPKGVDIVSVNNRLLHQLRQTSKEDWAEATEEARQRYM